MQQLDLFSLCEPADTTDIADASERHAEIRRRSQAGICQACNSPIDTEWLLMSFGWYCRACEQPPIRDAAGVLTKAGWLYDVHRQRLVCSTWMRGADTLTVPHVALDQVARWVRTDPRLSAQAIERRLRQQQRGDG